MKTLITLSILLMASVVLAQEDNLTKKVSISGTVDAYYKTNITSTDKAIFGDDADQFQSFGTSFANETGFALGMANIIAKYEGEKTGVVADLAFGPRADAATGGFNINQLYAYWNVSEGTKITMGRFNTYIGYEVISPAVNFNYSTSYLFSSGPFSHVGLKADFSLSDDFSLMLAAMNVTDENSNLTGQYALGAQLGYARQFLNLYYDDKAKLGFEIDYTGGFDLTDTFFLGINAAYADNEGNGFYGAALYPQLAASNAFKVGLRGEYFAQMVDGISDDQNVFGLTLTGSYTIENLMLKPEIRLDSNSEEVYFNNDLTPTKSLAAFTLAAIYSF